MKEGQLTQVLQEIAEQEVPGDLDLWSALQARVQGEPKRRTPLKRLAITLAGVTALVLALLFGLPLLESRQELSELPPLPSLRAYAQAGPPGTIGADVLPDAELVLGTSLPDAPGRMPAFRQPVRSPLSIEEAQRLASLFELKGAFYERRRPLPPSELSRDAQLVSATLSYDLFDGPRRLSVHGATGGFSYSDSSVSAAPTSASPLSFDQAAAVAEEFLKDRDLLDFSYRIEDQDDESEGHTVHLRQLVHDRPVRTLTYEIGGASVTLTSDGQVAAVAHDGPLRLERVAAYPVRTAQEAWDALLARQPERWMGFVLRETPREPTEEHPSVTMWSREYRPEELSHLYGSPVVYRPVDGEGVPLAQLKGLWLRGPRDEIEALVEKQNDRLHVWGRVVEEPSGELALDVAGWEVLSSISAPYDPPFRGIVERQNGNMLLHREDDGIFLLPNAPAGLSDGAAVSGRGWETDRVEGGYPVLAWSWLRTPPPTEEVPIAQMQGPGFSRRFETTQPFSPPEKLVVEQVDLVYYAVPFDAFVLAMDIPADSPMRVVQPMWRFAGHTDAGDTFDVLVQAVRDEYLEQD